MNKLSTKISSAISINIFIQLVHSNLWSFVLINLCILGINKIIIVSDIYEWIIDMIKEFTTSYELIIDIYIFNFLIIVITEILYFIDMFLIMLILFWSVMWSLSSLYFTDPNKLTFNNTIVLSCTSLWVIIYGISFIYSYGFQYSNYMVIFIVNIFIDVQWYDFNYYNMYFNDYIFGLIFYIITGLHLLHLIVGLLVSSMSLWYLIYIIHSIIYELVMLIFIDLYIFISLQLIYWHFLEMLWLFIYYNLYF